MRNVVNEKQTPYNLQWRTKIDDSFDSTVIIICVNEKKDAKKFCISQCEML